MKNYEKTRINELIRDYSSAIDETRKHSLLTQLGEFLPNAKDLMQIIEKHYVAKREYKNLKYKYEDEHEANLIQRTKN